jgi:hypothetical protein
MAAASTPVLPNVSENAGALDRDKHLAVTTQLIALVAAAASDPGLAQRTGCC